MEFNYELGPPDFFLFTQLSRCNKDTQGEQPSLNSTTELTSKQLHI